MECKDKNKYWFVQIIMLFLGAISYIFIEAEIKFILLRNGNLQKTLFLS